MLPRPPPPIWFARWRNRACSSTAIQSSSRPGQTSISLTLKRGWGDRSCNKSKHGAIPAYNVFSSLTSCELAPDPGQRVLPMVRGFLRLLELHMTHVQVSASSRFYLRDSRRPYLPHGTDLAYVPHILCLFISPGSLGTTSDPGSMLYAPDLYSLPPRSLTRGSNIRAQKMSSDGETRMRLWNTTKKGYIMPSISPCARQY
ncbi:hypothetical protein BS47DRAFT_1072985 [Hydnum rufescens UP504]|uniref:Uncharacterized protein n=1 Tax=Hydnum rufescens UP504 TaxID=1448309 RepID=A0A9P6E243_9AGAM|nr:hypothetical protein BS47DRAFT_1072985 [Hydnum rufescens UP504]